MGVNWSRFQILTWAATSLLLLSCVTINMVDNDLSKASGMTYDAPPQPFQPFDTDSADKAWQNQQTGSSISYVSSCNESNDPALDQLRKNIVGGISDLTIVKENKIQYNQREALDSTIGGKVDGVAIQNRIVIFKKNNCNYSLSYVALKEKFDKEEVIFENFVRSFKAP